MYRLLIVAIALCICSGQTNAKTNAYREISLQIEQVIVTCAKNYNFLYDLPPEAGDASLMDYHWAIDSYQINGEEVIVWLRFLTDSELENLPFNPEDRDTTVQIGDKNISFCELEKSITKQDQ